MYVYIYIIQDLSRHLRSECKWEKKECEFGALSTNPCSMKHLSADKEDPKVLQSHVEALRQEVLTNSAMTGSIRSDVQQFTEQFESAVCTRLMKLELRMDELTKSTNAILLLLNQMATRGGQGRQIEKEEEKESSASVMPQLFGNDDDSTSESECPGAVLFGGDDSSSSESEDDDDDSSD